MALVFDYIGTWIAAGLTLMILSFLYRDNPFFRFAEHLYLGISNAFIIWLLWATIVLPDFIGRVFVNLHPEQQPDWHPNYWFLIPGILGLIMLTRMIPAIAWMSKWALAFVVGWGAGVSIGPVLTSYVLAQVHATFPWANIAFIASGAPDWASVVNAVLIFIAVISVIVYFFFSYEHKGVIGKTARLGIWVLMVAFGASFGSTVMARVSLFVGRAGFLVREAEPRGHAFSILLSLGILIAIIAHFVSKRRQRLTPGEPPAEKAAD